MYGAAFKGSVFFTLHAISDAMTDQQQKRPRGRPPVAADQRLSERVELRLTFAQLAKLKVLGGGDWVRERIDKAKLTTYPQW